MGKREYQNGRRAALQMLDGLLNDADNMQVLKSGLESALRKNPMRFYRTVVMPLTPKSAIEEGSGDTATDQALQIQQALAMMNGLTCAPALPAASSSGQPAAVPGEQKTAGDDDD